MSNVYQFRRFWATNRCVNMIKMGNRRGLREFLTSDFYGKHLSRGFDSDLRFRRQLVPVRIGNGKLATILDTLTSPDHHRCKNEIIRVYKNVTRIGKLDSYRLRPLWVENRCSNIIKNTEHNEVLEAFLEHISIENPFQDVSIMIFAFEATYACTADSKLLK